jgi:hypothetical protein
VVGSKAEVFNVNRGDWMVNVTCKKHDKFAKLELRSSLIGRRLFAYSHFGKILTPIILVSIGHKPESSFFEVYWKKLGRDGLYVGGVLA